MQKSRYFLIVIIFFLAGFFLINQPAKNLIPENIKYVRIAGQNIKVELALTREAQAQGLSGRKTLNDDEGMLFIFPQSGNYPFWMKDMNFPIDIIWLGEDMRVVYIKKDARPDSYPNTFGPENVPTPEGVGIPIVNIGTKYVLEVVSGFSEKNNLQIGDGVKFTR